MANPNTNATGGWPEFALANPVVAFQGSARAPFLLLHLRTRWRALVRDEEKRALDAELSRVMQAHKTR